jgi:hypothetical protein
LPDRSPYRDLAAPKMVYCAEPILMIYGWKESIEALWIDE